jgi:hypothetical protein
LIALNLGPKSASLEMPTDSGGILLSTYLDRSGPVPVKRLDLRADEGVIVELAPR